jgi:vacuolar protein sorting-associated protein 33A
MASDTDRYTANMSRKVRGKKNLVVNKNLVGPVGLFVEFSVLREYGVDKIFLLENANVDSSQRNVIFLVHAEKVHQIGTVAGKSLEHPRSLHVNFFFFGFIMGLQ